MSMHYLAVLSHLMSKEHKLSEISKSRADLAVKLFKTGHFKSIITSGWDYRADSKIPISNVVADYISSSSEISLDHIISLPFSRDTVGDAFYIRKYFQADQPQSLTIITSDFHKNRTSIIFSRFFSGLIKTKVLAARTTNIDKEKIMVKENISLQQFKNDFRFTNFDDISSICLTLQMQHPYYNGKVFPKITCP